MKATYDHHADALYIALTEDRRVDRSIEDGIATLDLRNGKVVGIEILNPSPVLQLAEIAARHGFAHDLDRIYAVASMARGVHVSPPGRLTTSTATLPRRFDPGAAGARAVMEHGEALRRLADT